MPTTAELLQTALALHRGGQSEQARQLYEQILQRDPRHASALNLLGLLARQQGQFERAIEYLRQAVAIDGSQAAFFANLGESHRGLNQLTEAIECYWRAMRIQPSAPEVHYYLGTLLAETGQIEAAIRCFQQTIRLQPQLADAHCQLGILLHGQAKLPEAVSCYQQALRLNADHVGALINLGAILTNECNLAEARACYERVVELHPTLADGHYNLGNVFQAEGRWKDAIACYRRAVECKPDFADALCNLGNALKEDGELSQAMVYLEQAIRVRPDFAAAHSNLGSVLQNLSRLADAQACFERAIELAPRTAEFHYNLGTVIKDQGQPALGIACFEQALRLKPDYAQALSARGMTLVSMGQFAEGWAGYEHRVRCPQFDTLQFSEPRWDGSPLEGRTLLIHCEQGLGDTLQFIRYIKLARQRGDNIIVAAQESLIPLLAASGVAGLVSKEGPLPPFDVQAPLLSLPYIFRTEVDTVPRDVPYLAADPQRIDKWRRELSGHQGLKIGIAWQGRTAYSGDHYRSIPLADFAPLAAVRGVQLFSLQKGLGSEQLSALDNRFSVVDLASSLDTEGGAFLDTAAVMHSLDLVVACDTAVAHLAGALGQRVWLPLSVASDWRWIRDRDDCPWYPTMRLFRQRRFGDWPEVFERMANELRQLQPAN
ncbi:MAG: tetratricopeptide repeat protein [Planctomycetia bacterium]|nr:tetratricopeptide repeat protein [Planctomycetia bacterium]